MRRGILREHAHRTAWPGLPVPGEDSGASRILDPLRNAGTAIRWRWPALAALRRPPPADPRTRRARRMCRRVLPIAAPARLVPRHDPLRQRPRLGAGARAASGRLGSHAGHERAPGAGRCMESRSRPAPGRTRRATRGPARRDRLRRAVVGRRPPHRGLAVRRDRRGRGVSAAAGRHGRCRMVRDLARRHGAALVPRPVEHAEGSSPPPIARRPGPHPATGAAPAPARHPGQGRPGAVHLDTTAPAGATEPAEP